MPNGDTLNPGNVFNGYCDIDGPAGYPVYMGILSLPIPAHKDRYLLFHLNSIYLQDVGSIPFNLFCTEVDMRLDGGKGAVVKKNVPLISDTLALGFMTATRHANGRDWWIIVPEHQSNLYYLLRLTPDGISEIKKQKIGYVTEWRNWTGQAVFSPDGSKYA
jgi:hypothetical protein